MNDKETGLARHKVGLSAQVVGENKHSPASRGETSVSVERMYGLYLSIFDIDELLRHKRFLKEGMEEKLRNRLLSREKKLNAAI